MQQVMLCDLEHQVPSRHPSGSIGAAQLTHERYTGLVLTRGRFPIKMYEYKMRA